MLKRTILYTLVVVGMIAWLGGEVSVRAQNATPPGETAETVERSGDTLFSILFSGGPFGVTIMLVLFATSLTAAYLVFENILTIRRKELLPDGLGEQVRQCVISGNLTQADQLCRAQPSLLAAVVQRGLAEVEHGWAEVEKALEEALAEQAARITRKIEYLGVIGNLAPMLGLLGTVAGMILAFQQVASTQGSAGAAELAQGIYSALVTTVAGLIVAIPSLAALAVFRNRVDQFVAEAAWQAQHAFAPLKRRSLAPTTLPPPPPPAVPTRRG